MNLDARKESLIQLGENLQSFNLDAVSVIQEAVDRNRWFTIESVQQSMQAICDSYLDQEQLEEWIDSEGIREPDKAKRVGIVMAGNIPMVGFHDLLSALITGHHAYIKMSERDEVLIQYIIEKLCDINSAWKNRINVVERLKDFDAVIATGSDSTSRYFEKYFANYPHIIRRNRHGVGVIFRENGKSELQGIGDDIFNYYGLGCRNISKLYLEEGVAIDDIFELLEDYREVIHHNKYKNNYDYNYALYLLNKDKFYTNDFLLARKDNNISSRIASIHYEYFNDKESLTSLLNENKNEIQCIMSANAFGDIKTFPFGCAQKPGLVDYADGVNTISFLKNLDENSKREKS